MKLLLFTFVFSFFTFYQKADPVEKTAGLIRQGNVKELVKTFAPNVELTILSEEGVYSREQAETILSGFFSKNQVSGIRIIHQVDSNPAMRFAVCTLVTKNGNYRTSVSLRSSNGNFEVTELRIEEEKAK
ncbi:hypothetical protein BEL04_15105 [Mucilaginibacter sp. PPCGB 2223]|uniref:DUF4783 domain-containing protein n=1 Tax=Mucilaginibacter sp. PPCGB 2223 TaxID=1886027 RepID=UPI000824C86F|nr:DUF4783 domain-containing protein [Mucilaginibacter sp. PPCGB 2223]OCX51357.1 hypothetical protein BEL04_15105 [Mucilaginibacter sp. PPCGB 2223]